MNDPLADCLVTSFFLLERLFVAEQFHRQLVVGDLEERRELIANVTSGQRRPRRGDRRSAADLRRLNGRWRRGVSTVSGDIHASIVVWIRPTPRRHFADAITIVVIAALKSIDASIDAASASGFRSRDSQKLQPASVAVSTAADSWQCRHYNRS